jgi:cobalamin biosynthesis protein CobT
MSELEAQEGDDDSDELEDDGEGADSDGSEEEPGEEADETEDSADEEGEDSGGVEDGDGEDAAEAEASDEGEINDNPSEATIDPLISDRDLAEAAKLFKDMDDAAKKKMEEMAGDFDLDSYHSDVTHDLEMHITEVHEKLRDFIANPVKYGKSIHGHHDAGWGLPPDVRVRRWEEDLAKESKDVFDGYQDVVAALRSQLLMDLQAKGAVWERDKKRGNKLDDGRLVRAGYRDPRVFRNKVKRETINTAVTLLGDCSGSMSGSKVRSMMQLMALFGEALEMADVPNECLGFTTDHLFSATGKPKVGTRSEPLLHVVFKDFQERMMSHRDIWPTMFSLLANNVDGEAVLWAANRLIQRREERKVLIVLSDGQPSAGVRSYGSYGAFDAHLKDSVKRVESAGIEVIGVGIQDHSVTSYYPKNVVYRTLPDLMSGVYTMISKLLRQGRISM